MREKCKDKETEKKTETEGIFMEDYFKRNPSRLQYFNAVKIVDDPR